jgi:hypothetical protein
MKRKAYFHSQELRDAHSLLSATNGSAPAQEVEAMLPALPCQHGGSNEREITCILSGLLFVITVQGRRLPQPKAGSNRFAGDRHGYHNRSLEH